MKVKSSVRSIVLLLLLAGVSLPSDLLLAQVRGKRITSKRANGMTVVLTNESGRLVEGKNSICASFQAIEDGRPIDVLNVEIGFTLLVGRNRGSPATAQLIHDAAGRYCGMVDLGRQYYFPANYDVVVRYVNSFGKKRKISFGLSLR